VERLSVNARSAWWQLAQLIVPSMLKRASKKSLQPSAARAGVGGASSTAGNPSGTDKPVAAAEAIFIATTNIAHRLKRLDRFTPVNRLTFQTFLLRISV
jgi:hypothetical protein